MNSYSKPTGSAVPRIAAALLLAVVALGGIGSVRAQQPPSTADTKTVVEAYKQALTQIDQAGITNLMSDDVVLSLLGSTAKGKQQATQVIGQLISLNPGLSIAVGETTYVLTTGIDRFSFASDSLRAAGFERLWVIETLVVSNGKIISYAAVFDTSDAETARFVASQLDG